MRVFLDANLLTYLNTMTETNLRKAYVDFTMNLLAEERCFVNPLILDEVLYVSKRKHKVPYEVTIDFLDAQILPNVDVLPITLDEYRIATDLIKKYPVRPSDAIHIATMKAGKVNAIASEDHDFDGLEGINRVWIK
jgi:uncharacterized protein